MSCAGASEWSQIEQLFGTKASDWEGVPVPEVAAGDEIDSCLDDADTPGNSPATGAPAITGTAQVGETLTANTSGISDADGLSNATFSYQWLADDTAIQGATGSTYTLADADAGKAIKVAGQLHRRRGQLGRADQRSDGGGGVKYPSNGCADDQWHSASGTNPDG